MKKQFTKIKIAAENLSRSTKTERKDFELEIIEKQVDKYRETIEKILRKFPASSTSSSSGSGNSGGTEEFDKRIKKNQHYKIGQTLDESSRELSKDMPLREVLANCGELEKTIARCIVENELETEHKVVRRLRNILDKEIQEISTLKRNVSRTLQEYASLKRNYEAAIRLDEPEAKIKNLKCQQEECEIKLEKERDTWAAQMFELIAKEDDIVSCIRDYVLNQRNYHECALQRVNSSLARIHDTMQATEKLRFGTSLKEHLKSSNRDISYIIELCVCCLVENGLYEEGLLRVGCASTKLRRMKHALEAQYVKTPLPLDYQDPHVIGSILKLYLRELPEPLLTYNCYKDFIRAAEKCTEADRKADIKQILAKLPTENYQNLRYLTRFLWLVTQNVDFNKMNSQNLAIVMSPNMLWPRFDKSAATDYMGQVNSSSAGNIIVELLISQWSYFFDGQVDFFVTLQRQKLFVEGKSKTNSSNEHLEKNDSEVCESPRYGTIRRQKANAPSPPAKPNTDGAQVNGERVHIKELFPQTPQQNATNINAEKPEKPPLPRTLQFQQPQQQQQPQSQPQPQPQQQQPSNNQEPQIAPPATPKPVPMTRTQFFGLDSLPSPVADRKSSESTGSMTFKPDVPQKPKLPKRPVVLSLNNSGAAPLAHKSDDDLTPTQAQMGVEQIASVSAAATTTEKFLNKMRQENSDDAVVKSELGNGDAVSSLLREESGSSGSGNSIASNHNSNASKAIETNNQQSVKQLASSQITTPTTPISPSMYQTPKRPTVPAPPPPTNLKKAAD